MPRTASTPSRPRRALVALALAAATVAGSLGLSAPPVGAGVPAFCDGTPKYWTCHTYLAFMRRTPSQAEMDFWVGQLPARRTVMVVTIARSGESRRRTIERYYDQFADRLPNDGEKAYWEGEVLKPNGLRRLEAALLAEIDGTPSEWVQWAFLTVLGRGTSGPAEQLYWEGHAETKGYNATAAALAFTPEARNLRVRWTYRNETGYFPDPASLDYWANRLRTGLSYLDLRIALWSSTYPAHKGQCPAPAPPTKAVCGG